MNSTVLFTLLTTLVFFFIVVIMNLPLTRYYVAIHNRFSKGQEYKLFYKTYIETVPYKKELIDFVKVTKYNPFHWRKWARQNVIFDTRKLRTFNDYDYYNMDGVLIEIIKKENGADGHGCFHIEIFNLTKKEYMYHNTASEKLEDGKFHVFSRQDPFNIDFVKNLFKDSVYWKPVFNKKYKNWEEFDKLYKIKK